MSIAPASRLGPYEVVRLLSSGGMGEVYEARDTRLGRLVAVKVLSGDLSREPERLARFEQEAQAAGALNHPNIVAVYDVGSQGGVHYVVSELVGGVTLREKLRGGPLPPHAALGYAIQVARALAAAHGRGVIHRDVKPENVMITGEDLVKVVDFGLAKIDSGLSADLQTLTTRNVTVPGALIGTVAYMSPEQVRGEAADHRTDIFSLGTVLYEMLAGRRPVPDGNAAEMLTAILRDQPPRLEGLPADVEAVVSRALEKRREDRFQSARELAEALERCARRLAPGAGPWFQAAPAASARAIAVLPFSNVSGEPDSDYFSDGLTEELIHALTCVPGLRVVAWHSAAQLRGRDADARTLGRELKVNAILAGSVRKAGDRVRIAARLVDVDSGFYLWSETYDRQIQDLFAIQADLAGAIAGTLTRTLADARSPAPAVRRAGNLEAYNLYLQGRFFWNKRTDAGLRRSIELFQAAIALDDRFALAHAGLADAHCLLADFGLARPNDVLPQARAAAIRALELDPRSAEAHTSFGLIRSLYDWEWPEGEALFRRAIELNPGYATAHHWLGVDLLAMLGRFDEAEDEVETASQLDPLSLIIHEGRGYLLFLRRRYTEAVSAYRALGQLDAGFPRAFTSLGRVLIHTGDYSEAIAMLERGRQLAGDVPNILGALGQAHALAGHHAETRALLDRLTALAAGRHVPGTAFALAHAGLGEREQALDWLERGLKARDLSMAGLKVHPGYDSLRDHSRFDALLRQLRLDA